MLMYLLYTPISLLSEANYLSGLQKKMSIYFVLTVSYVKNMEILMA